MRLLICASEAPRSPLNGARLVLRELCRALAQRHEICVVAFRWPDQNGDPPAGIELHELEPPRIGRFGRGRDRGLSVLRGAPVDAVRLSAPMRRKLERVRAGKRFDVAHVMLGVLAGVAPALAGMPAVIAPLDAWPLNVAADLLRARGARRAWLHLQHRIVTRYLMHAYRPFARVVLVTREDELETIRADASLKTTVIENGVDTQYYCSDGGIVRDRQCMLFTGTLAYPPNALAVRFLATEILPRVRRALPEARLTIVGRDPQADVCALAQIRGVSVHANVADVRPYLAAAGVFACAMTSGTGIKNKLLEAMACGVPVVATPLACQGLTVQHGDEMLIANDAAAFATAILRIVEDEALAIQLSTVARRYVVAHHCWERVAARYEALYREVIDADRRLTNA